MDKFEYKVRAEEIKNLIAQGDYVQAAEIADTIDWRRVKSVMMLCTVSDLYKINRRFEDARDMLLLAYERRPGGRNICYSLCELSIKTGEFVQAMEYYKEFVQVAPRDPGRYILQYRLYEDQDVSLEERIEVLEELKRHDYREKWAYELAYLYHRVGLATRCVEECDQMILWFGEGDYVIKAMELKMLHQPLSEEQQEKYDHRFERTEDVSRSLEVSEEEFEDAFSENNGIIEKETVSGDTQIYKPVRDEDLEQVNYAEDYASNEEAEQSENLWEDDTPEPEEMEIHVKTMDMGQYNTINLQAELAQGLRELLEEEQREQNTEKQGIEHPITRSIVEPMLGTDTDTSHVSDLEDTEEAQTGDDGKGEELPETEPEDTEVFFGETGEISLEEMLARDVSVEQAGRLVAEDVSPAPFVEHNVRMTVVEPPKELAHVLSQEADGQISMVVPEKEPVEKQITGQMNIEDILAEWERWKKENEEKHREEVRQRVLQQTGNMFTEFEAAVRDGLLEQLEKSVNEPEESVTEEAVLYEGVEEDVMTGEVEREGTVPEEAVTGEAESEETEVEEAVTWEGETGGAILEEAVIGEGESEGTVVEEAVTGEAEREGTVPEEAVTWEGESEGTVPEEAVTWEGESEGTVPEETITGETTTKELSVEENRDTEAQNSTTGRSMSLEEQELYRDFLQHETTARQIIYAVDNITLAAYTGNVIITGEAGIDVLALAKTMIREMQATDNNFSGKVAKISGQGLNRKNVQDTLKQLQNGALIVENACDLEDKTTQTLHKALQNENLGIVVFLADDFKVMNRFLADRQYLLEVFTARVDVKALSNEMLVAYGKQYAKEKEYAIDELGLLALHTCIENRQTLDHAVTTTEVGELVDNAIRHANRKTLGHFFRILLSRRYDEEDMIIITEKDFS